MDPELYQLVDFIMNRADDGAVEVIIAALKKRGERRVNFAGINPDALARDMAGRLEQQMGFGVDQIRSMVREMALNVIRREAPELSEEDTRSLLDAWVPEDGIQTGPPPKELPPDVLRQMIKQFISYSTGTMSMTELERLEREIPGWQEKYISRFPAPVWALVKYTIEGNMSLDDFWEKVEGLLVQ